MTDNSDFMNVLAQSSASAGVSFDLVKKIAGVESGFKNIPTGVKKADGSPGSTAYGIGQITRGTWDGLAKRYPELGLTDRTSIIQQARAIPFLLRDYNSHIKRKIGRDPTDGESYLGWFLGPGDAPKVIQSDPTSASSMVVNPQSIAANPGTFGKNRTTGDLINWANGKMQSNPSAPGTVKYGDAPQFPTGGKANFLDATQAPNPYTNQERADREAAQVNDSFSFARGAWEAVKQENTLSYLFAANGGTYDPNFRMTPEWLKTNAKDVPDQYLGRLASATSADDFAAKRDRLMRDIEVDRKIDAMGLTGTGLRIFGAVVDPGGWLATAALGPLGAGVKAGRLGRIALGAAEGAAGNLLVEIPRSQNKPAWDASELLYAGAGGLAFGGAMGAFRNPAIAGELKQMDTAARALMLKVEEAHAGRSVGAAATPNYVDGVRGDVSDYLDKNFLDSDYANTGALNKGWMRYDTTGALKRSENPLVRALGNLLGEETVAQKGFKGDSKATFRAISEDQQMIQRRFDLAFTRDYWSSWKDYSKRNNIGMGAGWNGEEMKFRQQITSFIRGSDPMEEVDPAVARVGGTFKKLMGNYLELAKGDHRQLDGTMRAPLRGLKDVQPNEQYVPRLVNWERYNRLLHEVGEDGVRGLLRGALKGMNPDLGDDVVDKIATGYAKRLRNVDGGQEMQMSRLFTGEDVEEMRTYFRDAGLMDDQIEQALFQATAKDADKGVMSRTKRRTMLDENFRMEINGREVRLAELFHDDAMHIFQSYNRQMSGAIAMSRLQIKNPRWRPEDAEDIEEYLVNGIHSPGDWDTLLKKVAAVANDPMATPGAREALTGDLTKLNFMHDAITGTPMKLDRENPGLAAGLRLVRDYNFVRVMNQVGFAQVAEIGMITGGLGLKAAISSMPSMKTLLRDARTGRLTDELADELEWISTAGTDRIRGIGHIVTDDFGSPVTNMGANTTMMKVEGAVQRGTRITSMISGMDAVNAYTQRWASKAVLHKFANMAGGESVNRQRLHVLGLSDDMQERIFKSLREKGSYIDGEVSGRKLRRMNLEDWDPEVRGAFEHAIFRWTRKVIQENDVGQMHHMMGSAAGRLFFQFRQFMMAGWTKNTLHNSYMADWESMAMIAATSTFGALAYTAQTHLQSIGMSPDDRRKFLERRLNEGQLARAAFQRAGFSSLIPMLADTGLRLGDRDPLFDTRASGQPSGGLTSFAAASLYDSIHNGIKGLAGAAQGNGYSKQDWRALQSTLPFSNALPMMWFSNAMSSGLPNEKRK